MRIKIFVISFLMVTFFGVSAFAQEETVSVDNVEILDIACYQGTTVPGPSDPADNPPSCFLVLPPSNTCGTTGGNWYYLPQNGQTEWMLKIALSAFLSSKHVNVLYKCTVANSLDFKGIVGVTIR